MILTDSLIVNDTAINIIIVWVILPNRRIWRCDHIIITVSYT